ncbi:MAG: hypothetical protein LUQ65_07500 [Candidatus Helarchaeota archaeon]|nr:hypothetical protein [Candidatus Helarchaeota archaeon]
MDFEIKPLIDPNYDELSMFYTKVLRSKMEKVGEDYVPFTPDYVKYVVNIDFSNKALYLGFYSEKRLIATIGGTLVPVSFQGKEIKASAITCYAVDPDFPLTSEQKLRIFQTLFAKIREVGADLIWVVIISEFNGEEIQLFKDLNFVRVNKNVESLVKLLGHEAVDILRVKRDLNVVLAQLAKMMAGMEDPPPIDGTIRDVTPADHAQIIELFNSYAKELQLAQIWTLKSFQDYIDVTSLVNSLDYSAIKAEFPETPFGFHTAVWERQGKIIAVLLYRVMCVHFKNGDAPLGFWDYLAFAPGLDIADKKAFLITMYNRFYHKTIIINIFLPYYEYKAIDKAGFMSQHRNTPLYMFALTENGQKVLAQEKLLKFYLPTFTDFAI